MLFNSLGSTFGLPPTFHLNNDKYECDLLRNKWDWVFIYSFSRESQQSLWRLLIWLNHRTKPDSKFQASIEYILNIKYNEIKNLLKPSFERKIVKHVNFGFHTANHWCQRTKETTNLVTGYKLHMRKKQKFNVKQQSNVFDLIHTSYSSYFNVSYSIKIRQHFRSVQITNYLAVSCQCVL